MTSQAPPSLGTITLRPSYRLPFGLATLALPLFTVNPWLPLPFEAFALFLAIQAATLRLQFTDQGLDVYRGEKQIRPFPYQDWLHWEIYWSDLQILFYFREVNSIHFLPILFDPKQLQACLEARCPRITSATAVSGHDE
ncbi:DUF3119 family protein [Thermosynechococcaceae cyanobacterium BACA0444]|uniref:DUF3119 family protein n=1 Tax=Pseudocalidococcus azoricus BACA0444 TaxID=2918990 RepID=A0AAE4FQ56_9CYAN|nr:DUF3119 family protein [Pseudocalidococcus azoricus]MDS3860116.1 DUF3119 family protein [Pseudocalidococcus azoricus BACA0444]